VAYNQLKSSEEGRSALQKNLELVKEQQDKDPSSEIHFLKKDLEKLVSAINLIS
jgi:hypothetical protein